MRLSFAKFKILTLMSTKRIKKEDQLENTLSTYAMEGYIVWKPKSNSEMKETSKFQDAVKRVIKEKENLNIRQRNLFDRVQAARDMLKRKKIEWKIMRTTNKQ